MAGLKTGFDQKRKYVLIYFSEAVESQACKTEYQPNSDTSPNGECSLLKASKKYFILAQCDQKKFAKCLQSCPKMISLEK